MRGIVLRKQELEIKSCLEAIGKYADIGHTNMIKSCTICCYTGSEKSWCIQYCLLYCMSKGLIGVPTSVMSRRSVF